MPIRMRNVCPGDRGGRNATFSVRSYRHIEGLFFLRSTEKSLKFQIIFPGFRIRIHFLRIRIRIQRIRMEANTDPDPIRIQSGSRALMTKNGKKITAEKKIKFFFDQKLQFTYP